MKVPNAFVYIALMAPMLVAASTLKKVDVPNESDPSGVRGRKTNQRKLIYEHVVYEPGPKSKKGKGGYPTDDQAYPTDDDMYYESKGKGGKGTKSQKGGKGDEGGKGSKGGSKGGKGTMGGSKGGSSKGGCEEYKVVIQGLQAPSQANVPTTGNINDIGHTFIYNSPLYEDKALTIPIGGIDAPSAFVTGFCVRFQASAPVAGGTDVVAGAGSCVWTYTIELGHLEGTFEVSGELFDSVLSTMAITGGTGVYIGAEGEAEYIPTYPATATTKDVFTAASYYNMTATLIIKSCDPYHHYTQDYDY